MKMWSPSGKKQEESNINSIKPENFFLSFHSLCPDLLWFFYLLLNIILRKVKVLNY